MTYSFVPESEGKYEIVGNQLLIENGLKLSQIIDRLPDGIVDKGSTGIGATTCELQAPRNSVIVVPTKALAYNKALKHHCLYVGGPTGKVTKKIKKEDIQKYCSETSGYKKIIVVADSISKVIEAIGPTVYKDYFLMIDEIDSFQSEVNYRPKLEESIEYFLQFKHGCVVSATIREFTDPKLQIKDKHIIKYKTENKGKLIVYNSNVNTVDTLIHLVKEYDGEKDDRIKNHGEDIKIVIAYNSVESIMTVISHLDPDIQSRCKVLCSEKSSEKTSYNGINYFGELIDDKLPGTINFMTSAYYVGLDINESYFPLLANDGTLPHTLISPEKLEQIIGRCRVTKQSPRIIYDKNTIFVSELTENELIAKANMQISGLQMILDSRSDENLSGDKLIKAVEELMPGLGVPLVKLNKANRLEISHLAIDNELIQQNVKNVLYRSYDEFKNTIEKKGYEIEIKNKYLDSELDISKIRKYNEEKEGKSEEIKRKFIKDIKNEDFVDLNKYLKSITGEKLWRYYMAMTSDLGDIQIAENIEKYYLNKKTTKEMDSFMRTFQYIFMSAKDPWKIQIEKEFKVGKMYTSEEIFEKMVKIENKYGVFNKNFGTIKTRNRAVRLLGEMKKIKRSQKRGSENEQINSYLIEDVHPKAISIVQQYFWSFEDI